MMSRTERKPSVVYRIRNGRQQSYMYSGNDNPPTKAQTAHRKLFGKVIAIVNSIMADPKQVQEWTEKRLTYNQSIALDLTKKRYPTTRSYVHAVIAEQLQQREATKRRKKPITSVLPRGYKLRVKHFSSLTKTELYELLKARFKVFYTEQNCRYLDLDNIDYHAFHLCVFHKGEVIAYARLFEGKENGVWHIGRMLTTERQKGFGKYILEQTISEAMRLGAKALELHAQTQAIGFYQAYGFKKEGEVFIEADIPHVKMKKVL